MATETIDFNKLPYQKNYIIKQGDGLEAAWHILIKTEDATTYSDLSLIGCTLKLYVKKGATIVINGTAIVPDTESAGKFRLRIVGATTASWTGESVYEVECTFPVGNAYFPQGCIKTIIEGRVKVRLDVGS